MPDSFPKSHLESLWAPWRVEYFQTKDAAPADFLSEAARASDDAAHLVVTRRKQTFLIMNRYPYSAGHLMAVPYRKVSDMAILTDDEILELWHLCHHAQTLLKECVKAQGFNIGWNLGKAAGAGVDDHLHLHIVPRWVGDANFMTVIGDQRVIPEGLQTLYERLLAAQSVLAGNAPPLSGPPPPQ
jgi:ATP adenylyltransferase